MKFTLLVFVVVVAANQPWITAANPAEPRVCVYADGNDYRCNQNAKLSAARLEEIQGEILTIYNEDIPRRVYDADMDAFKQAYMVDAQVVSGDHIAMGWDEIEPFIQGVIGDGGRVIEFKNMNVLALSERRALILGGDFYLEGLHGQFIFIDWYKQADGSWRVLYEKIRFPA